MPNDAMPNDEPDINRAEAAPIDTALIDTVRGATGAVRRHRLRHALLRARAEARDDNVPLLSAGVAFYALLSLLPGLAAMISIYGLVANPATIQKQVVDSLAAAPKEVRDLVSNQLTSIAASSKGSTITAVVVGILLAVWTASRAVSHLIQAINVAYDERETRGYLRQRGLALVFTIGGIVLLLASFLVIALLPAWLASTGMGDSARIVTGLLRWVVLFAVMVLSLAVLYRFAPDRDEPRWRWASAGAAVAALIWLGGSILFSLYTANFAKYNQTYGSLGAVIVLMLWLFVTAFAVIVGAEINSVLERRADTEAAAADAAMSDPAAGQAVGGGFSIEDGFGGAGAVE